MTMFFRKILTTVIYSSLFVCQACLSAVYIPSNESSHGTLQFDNIIIDDAQQVSATLIATDTANIYAGQIFRLNPNLAESSGSQDASYDSSIEKIESSHVIQNETQEYNLILQLTKINYLSNLIEFTVIELRSIKIGNNALLEKQLTTIWSEAKGETGSPGPIGETGPTGPIGETGAMGLTGPPGTTGSIGLTGSQGVAGKTGSPGAFPEGNALGDMQYWNGKSWLSIPALTASVENRLPQLMICKGVPQWVIMKYQLGDTGPAGGIVFHVTDCGNHGLEASPDHLGLANWGCHPNTISGADATAVGTGAQNTTDILTDCTEPDSAAELANKFELNGFNDWFLPSKDELNLMYKLRSILGDSGNRHYWSSSEFSHSRAWYQAFKSNNGIIQSSRSKATSALVRAIRAF